MKIKSLSLLVVITLCFVTKSFAQKGNYRITNGITVFGGVTKMDVKTDNFITSKGNGLMGGMLATVDIPHKWYNISFGMQLSESNIGISARPSLTSALQEFLDYKLFAAQVAMLANIKLVESYVTIDIGPMLQYNGKMELKDKTKDGYFINNYDSLSAKDISNVSQFNINGIIGITAGVKFFKLKAQYIYGFTNILNKLNDQNINTSGSKTRFQGNQNMLVLGAAITF